jgi:hypothetical protein
MTQRRRELLPDDCSWRQPSQHNMASHGHFAILHIFAIRFTVTRINYDAPPHSSRLIDFSPKYNIALLIDNAKTDTHSFYPQAQQRALDFAVFKLDILPTMLNSIERAYPE